MNKKIITFIIAACCFLLLAGVSVGSLIKNGIISTDNLFSKSAEKDSQNGNVSNVSESQIDSNIPYPTTKVLLEEGTQFKLQYSDNDYAQNEFGDIIVKYNSKSVSKEKGDFDACGNFMETKDELGNITNEYSYVTTNITLINKGERELTTTLNNIWLSYGDGGTLKSELRSYNSGRENEHTKDYYTIDFEPEKEYNFNLAYIVDDKSIEQYNDGFLIYSSFLTTATIDGGNNILLIKKNSGEN